MPPALTIAFAALTGSVALWGMWVGWRHRGVRTGALVPDLPPVPPRTDPSLGEPVTGLIEATYVSSTVAGDWLERVVAHDLGVRSSAVVQVFAGGVRIERQGAADLFVPTAALRAVATAPGMAGKYVGGDGLVVLTWHVPTQGTTEDHPQDDRGDRTVGLDTGLRPRRTEDRAALLDAARGLLRPQTTDAGPARGAAGAPPRETA